ncbi:MAG: prolipoprotein diacylglyceryl transferase [Chromatiales bacterium]|nr:prolipoprotein diacylglyceryl transferase [Chromatiales bacterium]
MLVHPEFDPIALTLGPLQVHWYGLMYLIGFAGGWWLGRLRARPGSAWTPADMDDLVFYIALGVILGGRIGYTLFYGLDNFLSNPLTLFYIWQGGMSFHGGFLGVLLAMWIYGRKRDKGFWQVTDYIAPLVTIGLGAGRIGNFINQELWGKVSNLPWAMVFPAAGPEPRHPSMLYEAILEGPVLFLILWLYSAKPRPTMAVSALFLICYGVFRFGIEFVRLPDAHIGYLAFGWLTMGQVLSAPMILVGIGLIIFAHRRQPSQSKTL